jgi:hypothetical protein
MGHVKALEMTSCKYSIRRIEVKVDTVPSGNMNYIQDNMYLGQLPKRLIIGCVDSKNTSRLRRNLIFPSSVQTCFGPSMLTGP